MLNRPIILVVDNALTSSSSQLDVEVQAKKIVKFGIDPHLLNRKRPIWVVSCSNESMFMTKFVLTRTPTPPTALLSQVSRNSSSPAPKMTFGDLCFLIDDVLPNFPDLHHQILH
ncbi:hypothetical protein ANCDUO_08919 [Ancylostoma duodenale]|uniref:Uncharacterized protein n=1 Tax=Ancylostoma duodenale TaxID=51022 RepID=A0A0C2CV80_9BILA|nr:hypothetical protein ANCDUO_08919 [Ancylostoma duodenale]